MKNLPVSQNFKSYFDFYIVRLKIQTCQLLFSKYIEKREKYMPVPESYIIFMVINYK